ncbi:MAG: TAXI family TRAP transporter solute-binding subunit [Deltaproteobacteria bacterium]|nr:TAXI family TRAP transporter solute-binding subunit [Deltaproteobacteria bacterium]
MYAKSIAKWVGIWIAVLGVCSANASERKVFTIGATGKASSYYAYHVGVSQLLQNKIGYQATVQETGAAIDNKRLLERGQVDWAQFAEPDFFEFYKGLGKWEGKGQPQFRVFWAVNPIVYFIVVNKNSGIKSVEDLDGKKFCPGGRGSNTERMTMEFFEMLGVKPDWFRGGYSDAVAAMKDRRIVGYMKSGSISAPDATILDVQTAVPVDLISFSEANIATIKKKYPYYDFLTMEKTPYGIAPVTVRSVFFIMGTTKEMPEDSAYKIVKVISENVEFQAGTYPAIKGADVPALTLKAAQAPLHTGVIRYLRELGHEVPDRLVPPEAR